MWTDHCLPLALFPHPPRHLEAVPFINSSVPHTLGPRKGGRIFPSLVEILQGLLTITSPSGS